MSEFCRTAVSSVSFTRWCNSQSILCPSAWDCEGKDVYNYVLKYTHICVYKKNVNNSHLKFQVHNPYIERDIRIKQILVKKTFVNSYFLQFLAGFNIT